MTADLKRTLVLSLALATGFASSFCFAADAAPAKASPTTTQSAASGVAVRVQSVRITRANQQLQKLFPNRYLGNDGNPGVSIQLLMTLSDATVLPLQREAIALETFVDDTYQSLLAGSGEPRYSGNSGDSPAVSDDGDNVIFTITSARPVADDATRVFVRGSLEARIVRGKPEVASAPLPTNVGGTAEAGPFKLTLKSISDTGRTTALSLSITGDAGRIRKIRALGKDGRQLNEDRDARVTSQFTGSSDGSGGRERTSTVAINIPPAQENVSLEVTYAERVEDARIPFEVQVDVGGGTKAGPVEPSRRKPARGPALRGQARAGAEVTRPWPPPPAGVESDLFPPRRAPFDPSSRPSAAAGDAADADAAAAPKITKAAVDVFSLTVSKPAPGEVKDVVWANPPAPSFRASGFTVARLMLSVPDVSLLSVAPDGLTISRFEDDKGGKLDTTVFRDDAAMFYGRSNSSTGFVSSPDGRQGLLTFSLASAPSPGATKCTLAGTVHATVTRGDRTDTSEPIAVAKGQTFKAGPVTGTLTMVRQPPAISPAQPIPSAAQLELFVNVMGPLSRVRVIEIVDEGGRTVYTHSISRRVEMNENLTNTSFGFYVQPKVQTLTARVRHYDKTEAVEIPFEISTGVGL